MSGCPWPFCTSIRNDPGQNPPDLAHAFRFPQVWVIGACSYNGAGIRDHDPSSGMVDERTLVILLIFWVVACPASAIHLGAKRSTLNRQQTGEMFLCYQFALSDGLAGLVGFVGHSLQPAQIAASRGWRSNGLPYAR